MGPEDKVRIIIDQNLEKAGWKVQDYRSINLGASPGVAVGYFPLKNQLEADYVLFVDRKAIGIIEAKKEGHTLSGVSEQSSIYIESFPGNIPNYGIPLPFHYESNGTEIFFRDIRDPDSRSRRVFNFHKPETLKKWALDASTLRARLKELPPLIKDHLWKPQIPAIENLELALAENHPRALIQMATGSGKTYTAVNFVYRLIKFAKAKRVLFLVDRNNLGRQTLNEFQQFRTPDDGRKFTELYNVQRMTGNTIDDACKVCITTIQRLFSMLKGEPVFDESLEEDSLFFNSLERTPVEVVYNPAIPIETFDFIVTDECHRSIYNVWRQALEYFDAFIIGMTATPSKQTIGFFNSKIVSEYPHERAVADGVNVGYEVYRIKTRITEQGSTVEAGLYIDKRDRLTRKVRWEQLDDDLEYKSNQLDTSVVSKDQIRTIICTFRDKMFTEIFPDRSGVVPKTLIFAKDDSHAEDIVGIIREVFGKGNDFCKKITYKTTGEKPEDLISKFRNSYDPRIAVTVDMISTGTDIRPLECLIFMRDVRSSLLFEQMKGRGTRIINPTDMRSVTPGTGIKDGFVIVDAVGVCESAKNDSSILERKKTVPFEALIQSVALGNRDEDTLSTLACRLMKLMRRLEKAEHEEIKTLTNGKTISDIANSLLDAIDPDKHEERAKEKFKVPVPDEQQIKEAADEIKEESCRVFDDPKFRERLIEIRRSKEQIIDTVSQDEVISAGFDANAKEKSEKIIGTFKQYIEDHKDELAAHSIIFGKPYTQKQIAEDEIKNLAASIQNPPYFLTADKVWHAYEQLDRSRVQGASAHRLLADIISLLRFTAGDENVLRPFSETVEERFADWLKIQAEKGVKFSETELEWLKLIKEHVATSLSIKMDDFELTPFQARGGAMKVYQVFGERLNGILEELNKVLVG
ncbi:MAG: type I restriction-modification enzyme R subunit C-terminal domain-containing protein [Candidatus Wallbacteria bacterium]|nr:type I restriction-modification enzyme R subunit C-terminal domain-containing protein [Candidatus Wallbacteria bacterium]